jgi:hypothetical protein
MVERDPVAVPGGGDPLALQLLRGQRADARGLGGVQQRGRRGDAGALVVSA